MCLQGQILYVDALNAHAVAFAVDIANAEPQHTTTQLLGRPDPASVSISRVEYDSLVCGG
jgi:hypothetical protein